MCKLNDFLILNRRKIGYLTGSLTSHQWNGSAVVDYVLSPNEFTSYLHINISKFIWNEDVKRRYTNARKSKEGIDLAQTKNLKPIRIATEIKDILINNAEMCNQKKKKLPKVV